MYYKILIVIVLFFMGNITLWAQKKELFYKCPPEAIEISIKLNKKIFLPYEPILVLLEIKNISDKPQQIGPLDFFSLNLRYRLFQSNSLVERYFLWKESLSTGWGISRSTATAPNSEVKNEELINHYLDLSKKEGQFVLEIGYPIQGQINSGTIGVVAYKTKKVTFKISKGLEKDSIVLKIFESNFNKLMDGLNFTKRELEEDTFILAFKSIGELYPDSYLVEPSVFYMAFYYLQKYTLANEISNIKKAKQLFTYFLDKYPNSVYKMLVIEYIKTCNLTLNI